MIMNIPSRVIETLTSVLGRLAHGKTDKAVGIVAISRVTGGEKKKDTPPTRPQRTD
jgi:hypothetical protein